MQNGITTDTKLVAKKVKTDTSMYSIYIYVFIYQHGIKQFQPSIATGITIPVKDWKKEKMIGRNPNVKTTNEKLAGYVSKVNNMLAKLTIKKISTCSQIKTELEQNMRQLITGKAPIGKKTDYISKLKDYSFENIMKRLLADKKISVGRQRGYKRSYNLFLGYCNNDLPTIDQLTSEHFEGFKKWLKTNETLGHNTLTDYCSKIAAVIKYAIAIKVITINPLPPLFRGNWKNNERKVINETDIKAIMDIQDNELSHTDKVGKYSLLLQVLTGIGYGDLTAITKDHIKFNTDLQKWYIKKIGIKMKYRLKFICPQWQNTF